MISRVFSLKVWPREVYSLAPTMGSSLIASCSQASQLSKPKIIKAELAIEAI